MALLEIKNLHASIDSKEILKGVNLTIQPGEVHAIMGPNGSGKSTLSAVIAGREDYEVTDGDILLNGKSILDLAPEMRAREGIFIGFQYPVAVPGVNNMQFLRTALNAVRKHHGETELNAADFLKLARSEMAGIDMNADLIKRSLNDGFSGGEKKKNEILQMSLLSPKVAILDETDSGLDIDALKSVAEGVNRFRSPEKGILLVTHYQRLLSYIVPDFVHVFADGQIQKSGGKELAEHLEKFGYDDFKKDGAENVA